MSIEDAGTGTCFHEKYKGENLYVTLTDQSLEMSMTLKDHLGAIDENTLTGLDMLGVLLTMLIENDVDKEEISGRIWETSRNKNDLADTLSMVLIKEV